MGFCYLSRVAPWVVAGLPLVIQPCGVCEPELWSLKGGAVDALVNTDQVHPRRPNHSLNFRQFPQIGFKRGFK